MCTRMKCAQKWMGRVFYTFIKMATCKVVWDGLYAKRGGSVQNVWGEWSARACFNFKELCTLPFEKWLSMGLLGKEKEKNT